MLRSCRFSYCLGLYVRRKKLTTASAPLASYMLIYFFLVNKLFFSLSLLVSFLCIHCSIIKWLISYVYFCPPLHIHNRVENGANHSSSVTYSDQVKNFTQANVPCKKGGKRRTGPTVTSSAGQLLHSNTCLCSHTHWLWKKIKNIVR